MEEKINNLQTDNKLGRPFGSYKYTPEELLTEAMEYFDYCDKNTMTNGYGKEVGKPKTLTGLAKWLGVAKDYISEKLKDENYSEMIKYIRNQVENDIEEKAMLGVYNPTIAAKNLSANFDWKDKSEVDNTIKGDITINDYKNLSTEELLKLKVGIKN